MSRHNGILFFHSFIHSFIQSSYSNLRTYYAQGILLGIIRYTNLKSSLESRRLQFSMEYFDIRQSDKYHH